MGNMNLQDIAELGYDGIISMLCDIKESESEALWSQGALIYVLKNRLNVQTGDIAHYLNCTSRHVNSLAKTFAAFPGEDDRNKQLTFNHHAVAAGTDDPAFWLSEAEENSYSIRELKQAIKPTPEDTEMRQAQNLLERLEKFLEQGGDAAEWLKEEAEKVLESHR